METRTILPASMDFLLPATAFVEALAQSQGFSESERMQLALALEEAFINVVKHGFCGDKEKTLEIICQPSSMGLSVAIRDKGMPFDPSQIPEYSPEKTDRDQTPKGLGTFLIKSSVDEVSYKNLGKEGKELQFTKYLSGKRIENLLDSKEMSTPASPPPAVVEPVEYELRPLADNEAVEVSRCAYSAYGYTYMEYIYYPERISEMNRQGLLKSVAAVDQTGRFMAHMALKFKAASDKIAESGTAFVKPEFRRMGLMGQMDNWLRREAEKQGLMGVFGRSVTSHTASQRMSAAQGYTECGVMLGSFSTLDFKKIAGQVKHRETGVISFQNLVDPPPALVYPPLKHRNWVLKLFESLNVPVQCEEPGATCFPPDGDCIYREEVSGVFNVAEITVRRYGTKVEQEIRGRLKKHCFEQRDVIHLWLSLQDPFTPAMAQAMEELGFIIAGILPFALEGSHALILQYLNNVPLDFDSIKIVSQAGRELLDYIREQAAGL